MMTTFTAGLAVMEKKREGMTQLHCETFMKPIVDPGNMHSFEK